MTDQELLEQNVLLRTIVNELLSYLHICEADLVDPGNLSPVEQRILALLKEVGAVAVKYVRIIPVEEVEKSVVEEAASILAETHTARLCSACFHTQYNHVKGRGACCIIADGDLCVCEVFV